MSDTVKNAVNRIAAGVTGIALDTDGTGNIFETDDDNPTTSTPTLYITLNSNMGADVNRFKLTNVEYWLNQTNGVTYTLYLFAGATADDVTHLSELVFQSPAAQADSTLYWYRESYSGTPDTIATLDATLPVIVDLKVANRLYYTINWSGAPGNTPGFIRVAGDLMK